jgi:hypothetical protein
VEVEFPAVESAVQVYAIVNFAIIGLSHIFAPRAWAQFFMLLREKGHAGVLVVAFISLSFGSVVAAFHPIWSGIPLVLTLIGWAQVLKAAIYFVFPGFGLRRLEVISVERARLFVYPGGAFVGIAGLLLYHLLSA